MNIKHKFNLEEKTLIDSITRGEWKVVAKLAGEKKRYQAIAGTCY